MEHRSEIRTRQNVTGRILVDEHSTLPCIIFDRSFRGVRVALPDTEPVPHIFVLAIDDTGEVFVCRSAWRKVDEIGAMADAPPNAGFGRSSLRRKPPSVEVAIERS